MRQHTHPKHNPFRVYHTRLFEVRTRNKKKYTKIELKVFFPLAQFDSIDAHLLENGPLLAL